MKLRIEEKSWKVHDAFLWPLADESVTPQAFALKMTKDLNLPSEATSMIGNRLVHQIERLRDIWLRKVEQIGHGYTPDVQEIVLEVDLNGFVLRDRFHWDINDLRSSPELFVEVLANDLGLKREHEVLISHALRVRLFELWESSLGRGVPPLSSSSSSLSSSVVRTSPLDEWTPHVVAKAAVASDGQQQEREKRYLERQSRVAAAKKIALDAEMGQEEEEEDGGGGGGGGGGQGEGNSQRDGGSDGNNTNNNNNNNNNDNGDDEDSYEDDDEDDE